VQGYPRPTIQLPPARKPPFLHATEPRPPPLESPASVYSPSGVISLLGAGTCRFLAVRSCAAKKSKSCTVAPDLSPDSGSPARVCLGPGVRVRRRVWVWCIWRSEVVRAVAFRGVVPSSKCCGIKIENRNKKKNSKKIQKKKSNGPRLRI
jgi:hypothetical protein